jgi:hypothetical protein
MKRLECSVEWGFANNSSLTMLSIGQGVLLCSCLLQAHPSFLGILVHDSAMMGFGTGNCIESRMDVWFGRRWIWCHTWNDP